MNNLLTRQLKKFFGSEPCLPEELKSFVAAVNETYTPFESDHKLLHRALELSSAELTQSNSELQAVFHAIPDLILKLDRDGNVVALKATEDREVDPQSVRFKKQQLGTNLSVIPNPAIRAQFERELKKTFQDRKGATFEYSTHSEFGDSFFEVRLIPLMEEDAIAIIQDITKRKQAVIENERLNQELIHASRRAGMSEVANCVLHNVGNVLNSVNISSGQLESTLRQSSASDVGRVASLLQQHKADLADYLSTDPKGCQIPAFLGQLAEALNRERTSSLTELNSLAGNIDHIKQIISMQQGIARAGGLQERLQVPDLFEQALGINIASLDRHEIEIVREFDELPMILADRHQVLQILVNLISNAKYAMLASDSPMKRLTLRAVANTTEPDFVSLQVADTGVGIKSENLKRLFAQGFTTKKDGHGFGLHSGALAAKQMGGRMEAASEGEGRGATFSIHLPVKQFSEKTNSNEIPSPSLSATFP